ncbi:MAG: IS4 family transposase [Polaromonas sp.]
MERVCSIFSQILRFIPRAQFEGAVRQHQSEKHAKGMTSWSQFIALLFCHLGGARSLREIVGGLAASEGKLKHLGVNRAPTRSTLAYANEHRPWQLYKTVFEQLVKLCQVEAQEKKRKFRFKHPLLALDATVIPVCVSMFEWASYVKTKGAVKLHLVLDNSSFLPQYAVITDGHTGDVTAAKKMEFSSGAMLVFDRGYEDHGWWRKLSANGVFFVSRLKDSTAYGIVEERPASPDVKILRDELILLASEKDPDQAMRLRRIEVWLEDKQDTMVFVTNHLKLAASTIAAIYKDRWQIELFFKAIKQSLRIKTFIGTSENAVQTQIWTALIAMLLVRYLQLRSTWDWGLSNLVALLRQQLFVYRDLWAWLNQPFQPPIALDDLQMALPMS